MMMRREFLNKTAGTVAAYLIAPSIGKGQAIPSGADFVDQETYRLSSRSMELCLSKTAPEFSELNIDGLGKKKRGANVLHPATKTGYSGSASKAGSVHRIVYRNSAGYVDWTIELAERSIRLISHWIEGSISEPFTFRFNLAQCHATVLGVFQKINTLSIPALIHLPGQGSIRIQSSVVDGLGLDYQAQRRSTLATLSLPAADAIRKHIEYTLDVAAIFPELPGLEGDDRFDSFRRNWLNAMQLNPSLGALANNTASTSCAFCYYEYADIAALTPLLAPGLTALDVMRQTLDRILAGGKAYGLPAPGNFPVESSDTPPSLVISAANVVRSGTSDTWLAANYEGIQKWIDKMIATDKDGNGLFEYAISGNSGIWPDGFPMTRPSNWWDTIGFGHEDAYGNALAYRSLVDMAFLAKRIGKAADANHYGTVATKLREAYLRNFYNPKTGVIGGWRSADGALHDYYFLWVNGIAIHYGLVPKDEANAIMDKLLSKMKEVGYDKFNMGLPGNLITVPLKDYVHKDPQAIHGGGVREDNADGFQNYENGGATGCFAFFTIAALYDLGRKKEADQILFAMLGEYDRGGFEGRGPSGRSNDWRRWDGTPMGYEGFLVDNYYTLLSVAVRQKETPWKSGYRPSTDLS
jgi:hypothetical protein